VAGSAHSAIPALALRLVMDAAKM